MLKLINLIESVFHTAFRNFLTIFSLQLSISSQIILFPTHMSQVPKSAQTSPKISAPSTSQQSTPQSKPSSKFLKRKPGHTRLVGNSSAKKHRESSINRRVGNSPQLEEVISDASSRFITQKKGRGSDCSESTLLESAKSQKNISLLKKELGMAINRVYEDVSRISRDSFLSKNSQDKSMLVPIDDYNHFGAPFRKNNKSRTEFFDLDLCSQGSELLAREQQAIYLQEKGDKTEQSRVFIQECYSLRKKNKWLQQQMDGYAQREYLLITEKNHLLQLLKEKELRILVLQKEIRQSRQKDGKGKPQRWRQELLQISIKLSREQQRYMNLKQENDYMQTQLIAKNEELIAIYAQHADQQSRHKKERAALAQRLDKMKIQLQRHKFDNAYDSEQLGQAQKLKERVIKQQQEIKYLHIQNQCLLICKDELTKSEVQVRKLRDQRDYFKQKVMDYIKRNRKMQEMSRSENSSILLQLSETSIDRK